MNLNFDCYFRLRCMLFPGTSDCLYRKLIHAVMWLSVEILGLWVYLKKVTPTKSRIVSIISILLVLRHRTWLIGIFKKLLDMLKRWCFECVTWRCGSQDSLTRINYTKMFAWLLPNRHISDNNVLVR